MTARSKCLICPLVLSLCIGCGVSTRKDAAAKANGKVYKTGAELLADMPKEAYPKSGHDGGIERAAARKWCKRHLPGRFIEWTAKVTDITIRGSARGDDALHVELNLDGIDAVAGLIDGVPPFGLASLGKAPFKIGDTPVIVLFGDESEWQDGVEAKGLYTADDVLVVYYGCTPAEAKQLRDLKGRQCTLRSHVLDAKVSE